MVFWRCWIVLNYLYWKSTRALWNRGKWVKIKKYNTNLNFPKALDMIPLRYLFKKQNQSFIQSFENIFKNTYVHKKHIKWQYTLASQFPSSLPIGCKRKQKRDLGVKGHFLSTWNQKEPGTFWHFADKLLIQSTLQSRLCQELSSE